jgi:hypothetical protein
VVTSEFIKVRVTPDVKRRVAAIAEREYLSESAWLRRLILRQLEANEGAGAPGDPELTVAASGACSSRVHIRLRREDSLLLGARAEARGTPGDLCFRPDAQPLAATGSITEGRAAGTPAQHRRAGCHWPEHQPDCESSQYRRPVTRVCQ